LSLHPAHGVQIHTPPPATAGIGRRVPETGPVLEADAEQELLDGFLAKLQAILRGDEPLRPAMGEDASARREGRGA